MSDVLRHVTVSDNVDLQGLWKARQYARRDDLFPPREFASFSTCEPSPLIQYTRERPFATVPALVAATADGRKMSRCASSPRAREKDSG